MRPENEVMTKVVEDKAKVDEDCGLGDWGQGD